MSEEAKVVAAVTAAAERKRLTAKQLKERRLKLVLKAVDTVYLTSKGHLSAWWRAKTIMSVRLGFYPEFGTEMVAREVIAQAASMNTVIGVLNDANRILEQISATVKVNNANDAAMDQKLAALNVRLKLIEDMAGKVSSEDEGAYVQ